MKKFIALFFLLQYVNIGFASSVDSLQYTADPVSASMGFVSTTLEKDNVWAVYNNQSSLNYINHPVIGITYGRIYNLFNAFNVVYGLPARRGYGSIAVQFIDYGNNDYISGIDLNTGLPIAIDTFHSYDLFVVAGYGNNTAIFNYGASIKLLQNSIANEKMTYIACDINFSKRLDNNVVIGINFRNIGVSINDTDTDMPTYIAAGTTIPLYFISATSGELFFINEFRYYPFKVFNKIWDGSLGIKYNYQAYEFRLGLFLDKENTYFFNLGTAGFSYNFIEQNIKFDYAITTEDYTLGFNHRISFTYFFNMRIKGVHRTYKFEKRDIKQVNKDEIKKKEEKLFKDFESDEEELEQVESEEWSDD